MSLLSFNSKWSIKLCTLYVVHTNLMQVSSHALFLYFGGRHNTVSVHI